MNGEEENETTLDEEIDGDALMNGLFPKTIGRHSKMAAAKKLLWGPDWLGLNGPSSLPWLRANCKL